MANSSKSFASNMISLHLWILFSFGIIKCFVFDTQIKDMHKYTTIVVVLFSVYFFIYLWFWNSYLTRNEIICGNYDFNVAAYSTIVPYLFVYGLGMLLVQQFPGWIRSFSNTFGLTFIRMGGYDEFIKDYVNYSKSTHEESQGEVSDIYKRIYENPTIFINELELDDEAVFMNHLRQVKFDTSDPKKINNLKKFINMKNSIGTFIWMALFSIITILTSQNTLLSQNCSKKIVEQKSFNDYINTQLSNSDAHFGIENSE